MLAEAVKFLPHRRLPLKELIRASKGTQEDPVLERSTSLLGLPKETRSYATVSGYVLDIAIFQPVVLPNISQKKGKPSPGTYNVINVKREYGLDRELLKRTKIWASFTKVTEYQPGKLLGRSLPVEEIRRQTLLET